MTYGSTIEHGKTGALSPHRVGVGLVTPTVPINRP